MRGKAVHCMNGVVAICERLVACIRASSFPDGALNEAQVKTLLDWWVLILNHDNINRTVYSGIGKGRTIQ